MTAAGIRIDDHIWDRWKRVAAESEEWELQMILRIDGPLDTAEAEEGLRESLAEVSEAIETASPLDAAGEPVFVGEWDIVQVADGVAVHVTEAEAFPTTLGSLSESLGRRGFRGRFELWTPPPGVEPPAIAEILACHIRLRGERLREGTSRYRWKPDPDAFGAFLGAVDHWCRAAGSAHSFSVGASGTLAVAPQEQVVARMRRGVMQGMPVCLTSVADDGVRAAAARAHGAVRLAVGGAAVDAGRWQPLLDELTALLAANADQLVYAGIWRGWDVRRTLSADYLPDDWPQREAEHPTGRGLTKLSFEDLYAPDAFGVQYLGSGYRDRPLPTSANWTSTRAGTDGAILKHTTPNAWFSESFLPTSTYLPRDARPTPAVLARAREELAPFLYTRGALAERGFPDLAPA